MNGLALCAGVGGLEIGLSSVIAHRIVCYVEREAYATACLIARMGEGRLDKAPVWSDIATFNGAPWRGIVDIITGGYPCQPFSVAGKRKGEHDSRHLWPHMARIVKDVQPSLCFFENVPGHVTLGLEQVRADLQGMGYDVQAGVFSAAEVGAPHLRKRLFILAHADGGVLREQQGRRCREGGQSAPFVGVDGETFIPQRLDGEVAHPNGSRQLQPSRSIPELGRWVRDSSAKRHDRWESEPNVGRVADGVPNRVDRLRALGNAVVPHTAALAFKTLMQKSLWATTSNPQALIGG